MPLKMILLSVILGIVVGAGVVQATRAYFSATAVSAVNTFTTAATFPSVSPAPANHVVINEVSPLGDNQDESVELFNPTNVAVDVSGWTVKDNNSTDTFGSGLSIPAGGYALIVTDPTTVATPSSVLMIRLNNKTIGDGLSNRGDKVILSDSSNNRVDGMSYGGNTDVLNPAPVAPTSGKTLQRHPNGVDTDSANDWISAAPTLGGTN